MRNQAQSRGDMVGGRHDDRGQHDQHGQDAGWSADDYQLRAGHHYADQQAEPEQEYDPRLYAPNPDEPYGYDDDGQPLYYEPEQKPAKTGPSGGVLMVAAVLAIAVIGGAGAVGYKMLGGGSLSGEPPLIRAETEPVKTVPEKKAEAQPNKAIYDRVDPAGAKSKVVSREEEPVDLPAAPASEPRGDGSRIILPGGTATAPTTPPDTHGSEPRRVKTMSIRPDAPIEPAGQPNSGQDPIAMAARTGEAPRGEFDGGIISDAGEPRLAAAPNPPAARPAPQPRPAAPAPAAQQPQAPAQQAARAAPAPQTTPAPQRPAAPAPQRTDPQQVAALQSPAAPAAARAGAGGFVVQVTSQRSEADARAAYSNLQRRFPQVLGPYQASIQSAQIADRGTYYRVRVGPFTNNSDAATVCNNLRAAGGDCVVSRN